MDRLIATNKLYEYKRVLDGEWGERTGKYEPAGDWVVRNAFRVDDIPPGAHRYKIETD